MKNLIIIPIALLLSIGCSREENTPEIPAMDMVDTSAVISQLGMFMGTPGETVMGSAKITNNQGKYALVLDQFSTSNGPDLHVYLAQTASPDNFINLGRLKSTSGTQVYAIPGTPDFSKYRYALIHCQQYNHLFGSALLE